MNLFLAVLLIIVATWKLYRLISQDTGPYQILRRFRIWAGVHYTSSDFSTWWTKDGSFAEMITCSKCAPLWEGAVLTAVFLLLPIWVFLAVTIPLVAGAFVLLLEALMPAVKGGAVDKF